MGGEKKKKKKTGRGWKNLSEEQRRREKRKERGERKGSVNPFGSFKATSKKMHCTGKIQEVDRRKRK